MAAKRNQNRNPDRVKLRARVSSKTKAAKTGDGRWWSAPEAHRGQSLWDTVEVLDKYNGARHMRDALYVALYENELPHWLHAGGSSTASPANPVTFGMGEGSGFKATFNLIKSVTDTVAALLSKNLAEVRVLTSGGTWRQQQRSKKLTKYLAGAFDSMDYHAHRGRAFIDGCLTQKGAVKFWADKSRAKVDCERIAPHTLIWNALDGDSPKNLYQKEPQTRETLTSLFPEHADAIEKAEPALNPLNPAYRRASGLSEHADMVDVVEGWHLPSGLDADGKPKGGRHVMMIEGTVLLDETWEHDFFPFATYVWDDAYQGFGGKPLADIVYPYQRRLGRMMRTIQRAQDLACVPRVFREKGSEVIGDQLTDEIGGVVDYVGTPPTIAAASAMPAEYYDFFWKLKEEAFAEAGISLLQSRGEKPSGLDSEPSLREYNDITNTRQVTKGQRLEAMDKQAAAIIIALSRDLYEDDHKLEVLAPGTKFLEQIQWSEVDMEEDTYTLRSFAVSALPTHAVGRIQTVTELIKAGIVPQDEAAGLLGFPDLEKVTTLMNANKDLAMMQVDSALYEGEYIAVEPYQDTELLVTLATKELLFSKQMRGVPRKNTDYLLRLISDGAEWTKRKTTAPAPVAAPPPAPGMPAPPQQALLPAAQMAPNIPEAAALPAPALPTTSPAGILG